jgi:diguanylate cyclase (GGDEF)-like protein/PAS domain S-box-containing protein
MIRRSVHIGVLLSATLGASTLCAAQETAAPVRPIAEALATEGSNTLVTVAGRATVGAGQLQSSGFEIALQDASGGVRVFSRTLRLPVKEGDSVMATGTIRRYRGDRELVATAFSIVPAPRRLTLPRDLAIDAATMAQHPGELVRVSGRAMASGHSEGGRWIRLADAGSIASGTVTVWVPANHGAPIDLTSIQTHDSLTIAGIVTSYQDNADDPVVWQLVPRTMGDVVVMASDPEWPAWLLWSLIGGGAAALAALVLVRLNSRRHLRTLRETDARYRQLLELSPEAVLVHANGKILFTNPAAAEMLGLASENVLVGQPIDDFADENTRAALAGQATDDAGGRAPRVRGRLRTVGGGTLDVEIVSSPCVYHDRPAVVVLARDISAQLRYERDLHALALIDELTGLHNRRGFTLFAEQELARARRHGRVPVLVFADLDDLKGINDLHGHASGDAAIKLVASAFKSILREADIVARWSGDEFVALLSDGDQAAARQIDARLASAIASQAQPDLPYSVSVTVGTSTLDPTLALREALERADAELYSRKKYSRRGRPTPVVRIDVVGEPD